MATTFSKYMKAAHEAKAKAAELAGKRFSLSIAAEELGTTKSYLCGIVNGSLAAPAPKLLEKMARFYGLDPIETLLRAEASKTAKKVRPVFERLVDEEVGVRSGGRYAKV